MKKARRNSRKHVAVLTILCMLLTLLPIGVQAAEVQTTADPAPTFRDIDSHWGKAAIEKWSGQGIINGYNGLFRPDDSITRGEMAVILDNLMDYQVAAANTFTDLKAGQFYTDAILKANAAGIILGDGITVRPLDKITREEAAAMLSRALAVPGSASAMTFTDASSVSAWAKSAVAGMAAKGYVSGYGGKFDPKANVTRAAVVTMINNIVKAYYTEAGTYTENVAGTAVIKVSDVVLKGVTVAENLIVAEGVGQGDATLDSVTVKGETVIRGGGENSIHIIGTSSLTSVRIEKIGDSLRIVIADGLTIQEVIVAAGEEIIVTGTVGTLELSADGATVYATAAEIVSASVTGSGSTIVVGAASSIESIQVASGAANTTIRTESGAEVGTVTAAAPVLVSGTGTVTTVELNAGSNGSSITTPKTVIEVATAVTGVTGTGGTAIPAGETGTNGNTTTAPATVGDVAPPAGGGGGGGSVIEVSAISVDKSTLTLTAGGATGTITATVLPAGATNKTVTWTSSNEAAATIVGGVVTPLTAGTATITAATVDGTKTATCKVVVIGAGDKVVNITNYGVYETIQLAIAAAVDGDTIVLGSDTTVTETVRITSGQSITLDLNGKTVSSTLATTFRVEEGTLNVVDTADVKGGISVRGEAFRVNGQGNTLVTDAILNIGTGVNVTSSTDCCVFIYGKATLNTAGNLTSNGLYAPIQGNGTAINDGTVINITGGKVIATLAGYHAIYVPQNVQMNISGGEISSAGTAIEAKGGTLTISGGTISITAESSSHTPNNNGGSAIGYAVAVIHNSNYSGAEVTISGGTFNGPVALLDDDANTDNNNSSLTISGGTFSDLPNAVKYATANAEVNVKLVSNTALTSTVLITSGQSITLDLNGKTISSTLSTAFRLAKGSLNVVDTAASKGGINVTGEAFRVSGTLNSLATDAVLDIGTGVNVSSSTDCCVFIYGNATLNTAGNLTSSGVYATIQGNGTATSNGTVINITDGNVISTMAGKHTIYVPQDGEMTISGGIITSAGTVIEAKGGTVTISAGTISTTAESSSHTPNNNGGSAIGYAVAVIHNSNYSGAEVTISGGTFNGPVELLDDDDNTDNNNSSLTISGGTFSDLGGR